MIELILGKNSFEIAKLQKEKRQEYIDEHGVESVVAVDAYEADWPELHQAMEGMSLFGSAEKLVILRGIEANKSLADKLTQEMESISSSTYLLVVSPGLDKRGILYKAIKKEGLVTDCTERDESSLTRWIAEYIQSIDGEISFGDARLIVERVGSSQLLLTSEADKLVMYDKKVSKANIELMIEARVTDTIFQMLDLMMDGKGSAAVAVYDRLRIDRLQPIYILTMIGWQLHSVLAVAVARDMSERDIAKTTKLSPFVIGKSKRLMRGKSMHDIRLIIAAAAELDVKVKSTKIDAEAAVRSLIISIAQRA